MATRKWYVLMLLSTIALWSLSYLTRSSHDGSLQVLSSVATMGAMMCSFILVAVIYLSVTGRGRSRGRHADERVFNDPKMFPSPPTTAATPAIARAEQTKQLTNRFSAIAGAGAVVALLGYGPVARYIQILSPIRFWVVVLALSAAVAVAVHLLYTRRLLPQIAKRSDRVGMMILPALVIVPCLAIALRLMNAPLGLLIPPQTKMGIVTDTSVWGGQRSWASHSVKVNLDSGESISLGVSYRNSQNLPIGTTVKVQTRSGLLGMPWCQGECLTPVEQPPQQCAQ